MYGSYHCAACRREDAKHRQRLRRAERYGVPLQLFGAWNDPIPNLRATRHQVGLTAAELGRLAGLHKETVLRIERQESRGWPTTRQRIIEALLPYLTRQRELRE